MTEQPIAPIRQSSFSDAVTIGALNTKLAEANALLSKWKISVLGDVMSTALGFTVKLNIFKDNGQGIIRTIEAADVAYYAQDPASLVDRIVDEVFEHLLRQQLRNEIAPYVNNGIKNALLHQSRKS